MKRNRSPNTSNGSASSPIYKKTANDSSESDNTMNINEEYLINENSLNEQNKEYHDDGDENGDLDSLI